MFGPGPSKFNRGGPHNRNKPQNRNKDLVIHPADIVTQPKITRADIRRLPSYMQMMDLLYCCSSCRGIPPKNSFVCPDGHITCIECVSEMDIKVCKSVLPPVPPSSSSSSNWSWSSSSDGQEPLRCSKMMKRAPCFVYDVIFNLSKMKCLEEPCNEEYLGKDMAEHRLTCVGCENLSCPETECNYLNAELMTKATFVNHVMLEPHVETYAGVQKIFKVQHWWFTRENAKITFTMKSHNNLWIGVGRSDYVDGVEACAFILYHVPNVDPEKAPRERFATRFISNLTFIGEKNRTIMAWVGTSPSIYDNQEKIRAANQCLVLNLEPKEIRYLEVDLIEQRVGTLSTPPELQWEPYSRPKVMQEEES